MDTEQHSPAFTQSPGLRPVSAGAQGNTNFWADSTEAMALQQPTRCGLPWGARLEVGPVGEGGEGL